MTQYTLKSQKGASLIFVLLSLLVLTLVGTLAVRVSLVSLSVATNSQIQVLLQQSSDAALFKMQDPAFLSGYLAGTGPLGYIRKPENKDKEIVFCFRADRADFFNISDASVIYADLSKETSNDQPGQIINNDSGTAGYCDPRFKLSSSLNFFTSKRKAIMTQITVKQNAEQPCGILTCLTEASDPYNAKLEKSQNFTVYATSILPNYGSATNDQIYDCLSKKMSGPPTGANATDAVSMTDCLSNLNVPFSTQTANYRYNVSFAN